MYKTNRHIPVNTDYSKSNKQENLPKNEINEEIENKEIEKQEIETKEKEPKKKKKKMVSIKKKVLFMIQIIFVMFR